VVRVRMRMVVRREWMERAFIGTMLRRPESD
jgi:hypothetical protein